MSDESEKPQEPAIGYVEALGEHATNPEQPKTIGDTIYSLVCEHCNGDKCEECDHTGNGKWIVSECEDRLKAQFEMWVRNNQKKYIVQLEENGDIEEADKQREMFQENMSHYCWGGKCIRKALSDFPGLWHLFFLLLRRCHLKMTEAKARKIFNGNPKDAMLAMKWSQGNSEAPPAEERDSSKSQLAGQQSKKNQPTTNGSSTKKSKPQVPATMD